MSILSIIAFGKYDNECVDVFPCKINVNIHINTSIYKYIFKPLFSLNFIGLNGVGELVNLYPVLNISTFQVLVISLRINMMSFFRIKKIPKVFLNIHNQYIYIYT